MAPNRPSLRRARRLRAARSRAPQTGPSAARRRKPLPAARRRHPAHGALASERARSAAASKADRANRVRASGRHRSPWSPKQNWSRRYRARRRRRARASNSRARAPRSTRPPAKAALPPTIPGPTRRPFRRPCEAASASLANHSLPHAARARRSLRRNRLRRYCANPIRFRRGRAGESIPIEPGGGVRAKWKWAGMPCEPDPSLRIWNGMYAGCRMQKQRLAAHFRFIAGWRLRSQNPNDARQSGIQRQKRCFSRRV
ncbi:MAG: hypothetical protein BWZ10_01720 [candidate division BRC1 bacterium ADurb.BinA364]|nr:MAG: hypothetical protein BWZ10_01720 [candidate division BRC1 bacterium ADurb.BinA364]